MAWAADPDVAPEQLARHRNLGKAYYEKPASLAQAVEEFRRATALAPGSLRDRVNLGLALLRAGQTREGIVQLESVQRQDPTIPHTWFNLGIVHRREGRLDEARRQFERMVQLVPDEPVSRYNLGVLHKLAGRPDAALRELEAAARLDPNLAAPHYQLQGLHRQAGRAAEAERHLQLFQELTKRQAGAAIPEDMEWSAYAEVWEALDPAGPAEPAGAAPELRLDIRRVTGGVDPATAGLAVLDAFGERRTGPPRVVTHGRPAAPPWRHRGSGRGTRRAS